MWFLRSGYDYGAVIRDCLSGPVNVLLGLRPERAIVMPRPDCSAGLWRVGSRIIRQQAVAKPPDSLCMWSPAPRGRPPGGPLRPRFDHRRALCPATGQCYCGPRAVHPTRVALSKPGHPDRHPGAIQLQHDSRDDNVHPHTYPHDDHLWGPRLDPFPPIPLHLPEVEPRPSTADSGCRSTPQRQCEYRRPGAWARLCSGATCMPRFCPRGRSNLALPGRQATSHSPFWAVKILSPGMFL